MIGLGVGIDYSLLVVSRYLQNRDEGMEHEDAVAHAIGTAGCGVAVRRHVRGDRAVRPLRSRASRTSRRSASRPRSSSRVMVLAALTLLPGGARHRSARASRASTRTSRPPKEVGGLWYRFAHVVVAARGALRRGSLIVLAVLAAPILDLRARLHRRRQRARRRRPSARPTTSSPTGFGEGAERSAARRDLAPDGDRRRTRPPIVADVEKLARRARQGDRASRR